MLPLISQAANKLECRTGPKSCMFGLWKLGHAIYADYERVHLFDLVFDMHKQIIQDYMYKCIITFFFFFFLPQNGKQSLKYFQNVEVVFISDAEPENSCLKGL